MLISKEFPKPIWEAEPRTLAEHLLRCRKRRGLLQREVAALIGVCEQSVIEWEAGKTPSVRIWPKLIAFLGYDPSPAPETLGERIKAARRCLGISLKELAQRLGCYEETVARWEADARQPTDANRQVLERLFSNQGAVSAPRFAELTAPSSARAGS